MHLDKIKQHAADAAEHTVNEFKEETEKVLDRVEDTAETVFQKAWAFVMRNKVSCILGVVAVVCLIVACAAMAE